MKKKIIKIIPLLLIIINIIMGMLIPILNVSAEEAPRGFGDADHSGSVFINVFPQPSMAGISAYVDGTATGNKLLAQDTMQSAEYLTTGIVFAFDSWNWNQKIINAVGDGVGELPKYVYESSGLTDNIFSSGGKDFKDVAINRQWMQNVTLSELSQLVSFFSGQSRILTMSVPGWTSSNDIWSISGDAPELLKESRNDEDSIYKKINVNSGTAGSSIVENLIGGYNEAMNYFDSYVETAGQGTKPTYDERGILNMALLIANGSMPAPGSKIEYDPATSKFTLKSGSWAKVNVVGNPNLRKGVGSELEDNKSQGKPASSSDLWASSGDGEVLVYMEVDGKSGTDKVDNTMRFPFVVSKSNTLSPESNQGKADVFALSYLDVLVSMAGGLYIGEGSAVNDSSSNTSVVGDQINGFLYDTVNNALAFLGIKSVDDLVFNNEGNLFKNNAYYVYLAIVAPFVVIAIMILFTSIAEVFRKSQLQYINVQQAGEVQSSVGNIANALLQIALLPTVVRLLVYFDQQLVGVAISLHKTLNALIGYRSAGTASPWESISAFIGGGFMNIAILIAIAILNVKFTWRYIARAISFAIYFCLAPIHFALDSMSGNGHILQIGGKSAESWKNLAGTILMRGFDAIGVVFSTTIGRLLFGNGILVSILGYFTVESITDAVRSSMGVANANIKGISEAGQDLHKKARAITFSAGAMATGALGTSIATAVQSEKNQMDAQQAALKYQKAKMDGNTLNKNNSNFDNSNSNLEASNEEASHKGSNQPKSSGGSHSFASEEDYKKISRQQIVNTGGTNQQIQHNEDNSGNVSRLDVSDDNNMDSNNDVNNIDNEVVDEHSANFAGFDDRFNNEDNTQFYKNKNTPDHPDWSINYVDTSDIDNNMRKGKHFYEDPSNVGINPTLSRGYRDTSKLNIARNLKRSVSRFMKRENPDFSFDNQNLNDEFGMSINKNKNFTNSKMGGIRSLLDRGYVGFKAANDWGIAYDRDTELTRDGVGHQTKMKYSGDKHYKEDKRGRLVAATAAAKAERLSRLTAAGVGGALSAVTPKNLLKTSLAIGAMSASKMSDGKIDDAIVASLYAKDLEGRRTGRSLGLGEMVAGSMVGRIAGLKPDNISASRITTLAGTRRKSKPNQGVLSNPATPNIKEDPNENIKSELLVAPDNSSAYKVSDITNSKYGEKHLNNIRTINEAMPDAFSYNDGVTNINHESLKNVMSNSKDSSVINSAQSLTDYIDSNGADLMKHNRDKQELGIVDNKVRKESFSSDQIDKDTGLQLISTSAEKNGSFTNKSGSEIYTYDKDKGEMHRFADVYDKGAQKVFAQQRATLKSQLLEHDPQGVETQGIINDMYSGNKDQQSAISNAEAAIERYRDGGIDSSGDTDQYEPNTKGSASSGSLYGDMGMDYSPSMEELMSGTNTSPNPSTNKGQTTQKTNTKDSNNTISKTDDAIDQFREGGGSSNNSDQFMSTPKQDSQSINKNFSGNFEKEVEAKESIDSQKKENIENKLGENHSDKLGNKNPGKPETTDKPTVQPSDNKTQDIKTETVNTKSPGSASPTQGTKQNNPRQEPKSTSQTKVSSQPEQHINTQAKAQKNGNNPKIVNTQKQSMNKPKVDDFIRQQANAIDTNLDNKNDLDIRANAAKNAETRRNSRR